MEHYLDIAEQTQVIPLFIGPPGIGKTKRIEAWASARGRTVTKQVLALKDSREIIGLPYKKETARGEILTRYSIQSWFENLTDQSVLFLDEFLNIPEDIQAAILTLLSERELEGRRLPEGCMIVAASNPTASAANAYEIVACLASRLCWLTVSQDPQASSQYLAAIGNPAADFARTTFRMGADPNSLELVEKMPVANDRTVEYAGRVWAVSQDQYAQDMVKGLLGPAWGEKFIQYFQSDKIKPLPECQTEQEVLDRFQFLLAEKDEEGKCLDEVKAFLQASDDNYATVKSWLKPLSAAYPDVNNKVIYDKLQEIKRLFKKRLERIEKTVKT